MSSGSSSHSNTDNNNTNGQQQQQQQLQQKELLPPPDYEAKIDELQKWFQENPQLPNEIEPILLRRFYQCMYYNMDETKKLMELNYALRNKSPHIFIKRDALDEDSIRTFEYADMITLPGVTPENYKVTLYRLRDPDPYKMHHTEDTKAFFLISDLRFSMPDVEGSNALAVGEVQIFDMDGYTMKHVYRLTIATLRIYMRFLQEGFPVRLRSVHMINCPSYLDKVVAFVKPFISAEVFKLIHFHTQGMESLYDHIPLEMLPEEYGGKAGKMDDLKTKTMELLRQKRSYLMDPNHWHVESTPTKGRWNFWS